jgi:hypothetical protein
MGGGKSPPPAPDYTPFAQASLQTSAADAHAADLQYSLGQQQLAAQQQYAQQSGARADAYYNLSQQQADWGKQQFDQVWPYAQNYLQSQDSLNQLAGQNATEALATAQQQRQEATDTYNRYMGTFAPIENQFAATATGYNTPARAAAASGAAQADVASNFAGIAEANRNALRGYGIDPSQSRYQGVNAIMSSQQAAASAAAGTQARRQQEQTGLALQQAAIEVGQKLPPTAIAQLGAGTTASTAGLQTGSVGGAGIGGANQTIGAGVNAIGSPTSYAALANPYTSLSGTYGSLAGSLFSGGNAALGNAGTALYPGVSALNDSFSNQMSVYNAQVQQQQALWGGVGKLVGGGVGFALGGPAGASVGAGIGGGAGGLF